ncbi:hypothetical protein QYF61_010429 [Mycteria americana]|uniref:Uncharacterized protein n=1 Tax=Mycteria americana TaxID=33587 RepID=A0AAN7NL94_MYCAM|nr:hypothetical protein QYF61_010429 [Mycteria americana]
MGKYLGYWAPPVFWNFTPEQVQDPEKLVKYLEKVCCCPGNSRDAQITATCWGLAHAYQALLNTIQNPQGEEKVSGSDDKATGTAATPACPTTGTVATPTCSMTAAMAAPTPSATATTVTPTSATDTAVTPTPTTGTVAEPGNQPVPISVTPIHKKKSWKRKSAHLEREDERAGPSQGEEEEEEELVNETETTRSLSLSELRDMRKDFSHCPGEHTVTWLLRCWDNRASSLELERKWTTMERGIQYLRELSVLEVVYGDLNNEQLSKGPDEVQCT